jgi:hypothetical protein
MQTRPAKLGLTTFSPCKQLGGAFDSWRANTSISRPRQRNMTARGLGNRRRRLAGTFAQSLDTAATEVWIRLRNVSTRSLGSPSEFAISNLLTARRRQCRREN